MGKGLVPGFHKSLYACMYVRQLLVVAVQNILQLVRYGMHKIVTKWTPYAFKLIIWYWLFFVQNKQKNKTKK